MAEGKVRVIIKRPDEEFGHVTNISPRLENLQNTVGGYIETFTLGVYEWGSIYVICNEEGRLQGLPYNCELPAFGVDFCGDIIVASADPEGEMIDLPISFGAWKDLITGNSDF